MTTIPESWIMHLLDEFDRYAAAMVTLDGTGYRARNTGQPISRRQLEQVREEVIANATSDPTSLAYHVLLASGANSHVTDPCPTCDAAIRLAWGASRTRRSLGLPASDEVAEPELVTAQATRHA
jgi:hypothetical protein